VEHKEVNEQNNELDNLTELESMIEPDYDPAEDIKLSEAEKAADAAARAEAKASAQIAVGIVGSVVALVAPSVDVPAKQKELIAEKLEAVIFKYGAELPPWLAAYREELELAGVLAITGFGVYSQIKAAKAEAAKREQEAGQDGKEPESIAA
jgi:hypothetical protein